MKPALATLVTLLLAARAASAGDGIIDLVDPHRYAGQAVPDYITRDNTPAANPITDRGATLGRVLFHDRRLSVDGTISCSSCHQQEHGFSDPAIASSGVAGTTGRHSMRLVNARFGAERRFFWDERAATLEQQTTQPIRDHVEMGFSGADGDPGFADLVDRLAAHEEYHVLFTAVFGDGGITEERIQDSLAQFVRSIQSFDSKYDVGRGQVAGDAAPFPNFTAEENAGKRLFLDPPPQGGAGCAGCHRPPEFDIDPNSGNNGVAGAIGGGSDFTVTRAPSLRDVTNAAGNPNGGYMHDGAFLTLGQVVAHYNAIPAVVPGIDPRLTRPGPGGPQPQRLNLDAGERASLVAFLETLGGSSLYTDPKWSDPFDDAGAIALVVLPSDTIAMNFSGSGESRSVTLSGRAVPHVDYLFQSTHDFVEWSSHGVTADADGEVRLTLPAPASETSCYYRLAYATD